MSIKLPTVFMGKPIKGSIEQALAAAEASQNQPDQNAGRVPAPLGNMTPTTAVNDPQNYIVLPSATHGSYSYADTLVTMERTHHNKNWHDAHKALADEGAYMLSIRQFVDFLNLLKSGSASDGTGSLIQKPRLDEILDEISTVRSPWRSEWLDARFETRGGVTGIGSKMHILYENRFVNGQLVSQQTKELTNYLTSNKTPGIVLSEWLDNANEYGLPSANISTAQNGLYYWAPTNDRVARFVADSDGAYLYCYSYPADVSGSLWVRAARAKN